MISDESPFRSLSRDIPRRQILQLDGLRLSAEMAWLAYESLQNLLIELSKEDRGPLGDRVVRGLLHAYSVIDSGHRFRELLQHFRGLEHNAVYEIFMRGTKDVEPLRHIVQHLRGNVDRIAEEGLAALGTLTWLGPSAVPGGPPTSGILQPGTFYGKQLTYGPVIDLESSLSEHSIADISLATAGSKVNLSKLVERLQGFVKGLEPSLEEHVRNKERFNSDVIMAITLTPVAKQGDSSVDS